MTKEEICNHLVQVRESLYVDIDIFDKKSNRSRSKINEMLNVVISELSKPTWISVKDHLPYIEESVLVTSEEDPGEIWFSHRTYNPKVYQDEKNFAIYKGAPKITHWQRVLPLKKKEE